MGLIPHSRYLSGSQPFHLDLSPQEPPPPPLLSQPAASSRGAAPWPPRPTGSSPGRAAGRESWSWQPRQPRHAGTASLQKAAVIWFQYNSVRWRQHPPSAGLKFLRRDGARDSSPDLVSSSLPFSPLSLAVVGPARRQPAHERLRPSGSRLARILAPRTSSPPRLRPPGRPRPERMTQVRPISKAVDRRPPGPPSGRVIGLNTDAGHLIRVDDPGYNLVHYSVTR